MQLINIGFGNIVAANRIVSIVSPESAPIKRLVQEAKENKLAIDIYFPGAGAAAIFPKTSDNPGIFNEIA